MILMPHESGIFDIVALNSMVTEYFFLLLSVDISCFQPQVRREHENHSRQSGRVSQISRQHGTILYYHDTILNTRFFGSRHYVFILDSLT